MGRHKIVSNVLAYFENISAIPRESGNETQIAEWLESFAKDLSLNVIKDSSNNVVIYKPGQNGGENAPTIILQAHSDMVCEKTDSSAHDFKKDPICIIEKDGWLTAGNTTLGADNGLGVAFICMLLADKSLRHPPIEALITSSEEVGLLGMGAFDAGILCGKRMINLDAEENSVLIASCAGGARSELSLPVSRCKPKDGRVLYKIKLSGLSGGHSGVDIHKGGGNAILLIGRIMGGLLEAAGIQICDILAGTAPNVIPVRGELVFFADPSKYMQIESIVKDLRQVFTNELPSADGSLSIELLACEGNFQPFTDETIAGIIHCIALLPYGTMSCHEKLPGQVNLSSNPGVIKATEDGIVIQSLTRGNINSATDQVVNKLNYLAALCGGTLKITSSYSAWEYAPYSQLREFALKSYSRQLEGKEMAVSSIHGGLECALMAEKIPGLDMISLGPTLLDVHTPNERFEIGTAAVFWAYLVGLISEELS